MTGWIKYFLDELKKAWGDEWISRADKGYFFAGIFSTVFIISICVAIKIVIG